MKKLLWLTMTLLCCMGSSVYQWVDEDGTVHFSSTPPREKAKAVQQLRDHKGGKPPELESIISGEWYTRSDQSLSRIMIYQPKNGRQNYSWSTDTDTGERIDHRGEVELTDDELVLIDRHSQIKRRYSYAVESATRTIIQSKNSGLYFTLHKFTNSTRELSHQGKLIQGIWQEEDPHTGRSSYMIEFEGNRFTRYRARGSYRFSPPNPNHKNTFGTWRMEDEALLVLEYFGGYDSFRSLDNATQFWVITSLSNTRMELTQRNGNQRLTFTRPRYGR